MSKLQNKVAVITGGGSGIGRAISLLFAAEGATVHILDLNIEGGQSVVSEITNQGGRGFVHACNVSLQDEVYQL